MKSLALGLVLEVLGGKFNKLSVRFDGSTTSFLFGVDIEEGVFGVLGVAELVLTTLEFLARNDVGVGVDLDDLTVLGEGV